MNFLLDILKPQSQKLKYQARKKKIKTQKIKFHLILPCLEVFLKVYVDL